MVIAYYNSLLSTYLGFPFLDFVAVGVFVLLVLILIVMKRGLR